MICGGTHITKTINKSSKLKVKKKRSKESKWGMKEGRNEGMKGGRYKGKRNKKNYQKWLSQKRGTKKGGFEKLFCVCKSLH